jgi:hypothetical protein
VGPALGEDTVGGLIVGAVVTFVADGEAGVGGFVLLVGRAVVTGAVVGINVGFLVGIKDGFTGALVGSDVGPPKLFRIELSPSTSPVPTTTGTHITGSFACCASKVTSVAQYWLETNLTQRISTSELNSTPIYSSQVSHTPGSYPCAQAVAILESNALFTEKDGPMSPEKMGALTEVTLVAAAQTELE